MKHVAFLIIAVVISAQLTAEEKKEKTEKVDMVALSICQEMAEDNGLKGDDSKIFVSQCMNSDNKKDIDVRW